MLDEIIMSSLTINLRKATKEYTELRVSPDVLEEIKSRVEDEFLPLLIRALEQRAKADGRKTIQDRDCTFFDHILWWRELG